MQVLKRGNPFKMERFCTGRGYGGGGCQALLLVEEQDLHYEMGTGDIYFVCSECKVKTLIGYEDIPKRMWGFLDKITD